MRTVAAVDCGATSVRVCRVDLDAPVLEPEVVHRVTHAPIRGADGHLRWDWSRLTAAVTEGLERALRLGPLESIGVDTWAVDYGLLDADGSLISAPYSYRDGRTDGYRSVVDAFGARELFAINGLQLQPFNTVFQLAAHDRAELSRADRLLWLPELLVHHLTGVAVTERTSAGCSGLVDVTTGDWAPQLLEVAGIDRAVLGEIATAGRIVGAWRGIPVALVAGHDTASAVVGMGASANGGSAFISTGTWILAGIERGQADTSEWARLHNFTNEAGALGGFRFLRNVTGFWILEQCRSSWANASLDNLVAAASEVALPVPVVDVDDPTLRAPDDMLRAYAACAGLTVTTPAPVVVRSIIESIAAATAEVVAQVATASTFDDVVLFGGAARIDQFRTLLAERTGRAVRVGHAEAAAVGNAIVQGIATGVFADIHEGRSRCGAALP